jgi:thiazole synthase
VTDSLVIAGKEFQSRLLVGTAKYPNQQILLDALATSGTEIVTVAIRRVAPANHAENLYDLLRGKYHLLPNTAGCYTARDAILTAQLAREALQTNWIKLEVIGDDDTLLPDVEQLLPAASELVRD